MALFGKSFRAAPGRYYAGKPPLFTSASAPDLAAEQDSGTGSQSSFNFEVFDPFNRGRTTYELTGGSLPRGFTLNTVTGVVSGTFQLDRVNTNAVKYDFTVTATDESSNLPVQTKVTRNYSITLAVPWKFRQLIGYTYLQGGYQNSVLWNNVNRCAHNTDTTVNLGDGFVDNFHYKSGPSSFDKGYVVNGGGVTAFNMRTEVKQNSGSTNFNGANTGTMWDPDHIYAWMNGEGTGGTTRRWTNSTESMTNVGGGWNSHAASINGEVQGIQWDNGGYTAIFRFSSETFVGASSSAGAHGQQKGISSKDDRGYGGNQGSYNGGFQFRVTQVSTSNRISIVSKPFGNHGEENFTQGQDHTYCLGTYDGAQNNRAYKWTYATDSGFETGSTTQPKGKGGCSSGHCCWRDA